MKKQDPKTLKALEIQETEEAIQGELETQRKKALESEETDTAKANRHWMKYVQLQRKLAKLHRTTAQR
jgi:uncharacterized protein YifE (UPF0438 family)